MSAAEIARALPWPERFRAMAAVGTHIMLLVLAVTVIVALLVAIVLGVQGYVTVPSVECRP
jgi:ABC-type transporter Mla maintaining outer membrane lipid asymmetry permease subunit MlaE